MSPHHPEDLALAEAARRGDPERCAAPLPRAYQWTDGSAYVNHVELVRKAEMPETFWTDHGRAPPQRRSQDAVPQAWQPGAYRDAG
nr:hypothetical protein [Pyxidicoccus caerfyrddinensis]